MIEDTQKQTRPEDNIFLFACTNQETAKKVKEFAAGMECVQLADRAVYDYLKTKEIGTQKSVEKFVSDGENRKRAAEHRDRLYTILTGETDLMNVNGREFTETGICKNTTLSHSKAKNLLDLLEAFGFITYTDHKAKRFKFNVTCEEQCESVKNGLESLVSAMQVDVARYRAILESFHVPEYEVRKKVKDILEPLFENANGQ